jgi:uncharacterized membrane protein
MNSQLSLDELAQANKKLTTIVYGLQAIGIFIGITYIIAVIINYVKREDVKGTWLESHFKWQIRTFWFSLVWVIIGAITAFFIIGYFILFAISIWIIYRILKGWLYLNDGKSMYT